MRGQDHSPSAAPAARLLAAWHEHVAGEQLFSGESFNLDFHSVPYYGEHPGVERHYVSARSRRQSSILVFLAQDAVGRAFCYSNADIRKGEEAQQIFRDIVDTPADVTTGDKQIVVRLHRQAHLPIILASGLLDHPLKVPWWHGRALHLTS